MGELDHAIRRGRVTASVIAQLIPGIYPDMNVFRGKDALDAFNRITGRFVDHGDAAKKAAGHRVERFLLDWFGEEERVEWAHFGSVLHPSFEYFLATPDAAALCRNGAKAVVECKAVGIYMADQWGDEWQGADGVPPYVLVQQEAQAEVCDADECITIGYFGGTDRRLYRWERDVSFGRYLLELARKFHRDHIAKDDPPPPGPWTSIESIAALYPEARKPLEPAWPDVADDVETLLSVRAQRTALEELEVGLRARIGAAIADRAGVTGEGWRALFNKRAGYTRPACEVAEARVLDVRRVKPKTDTKRKGTRAA